MTALSADEPVSAWTSLAYVGAGVAAFVLQGDGESAVFGAALAFLGAGAFAYHYRKGVGWTRDLDHASMNAAYLSLATGAVGGPWWTMALAAAAGAIVVEYVLDHPNRVLMGTLVWIAMVAGLFTGSLVLTVAGVVLMGLGFAAWNLEGDPWHGVWHLLTATGTVLMYLAVQ